MNQHKLFIATRGKACFMLKKGVKQTQSRRYPAQYTADLKMLDQENDRNREEMAYSQSRQKIRSDSMEKTSMEEEEKESKIIHKLMFYLSINNISFSFISWILALMYPFNSLSFNSSITIFTSLRLSSLNKNNISKVWLLSFLLLLSKFHFNS